jgi:outer membrane immunogenic protein
MKVISFSFVALILAGIVPTAANAQDFNGPSVGVQGGWVRNDLRNPTTDAGVVPVEASRDSAILGVYAGYDKTIGNIVLGAEGAINFGTSDAVSGRSGSSLYSIDPRRSIDLTARAGYLVTPSTLVYARGGYTNDRVRTTITTAAASTIASEDRDGWLVGGGVERAIMPHLSARAEYRYADLSNGDGKYDRHEVLTGLTWRF